MLSLRDISYKVNVDGNEKTILSGISFDFELGKNYVITGANGCGKSTLAKIIMGIIEPTSGEIYLDGRDITNFSVTERAKLGLAYAMQQPVRFKGITAGEILEIATGKAEHTSSACEYLSKVGLCAREYLNRELDNTLSGGELKRIEIATTLARKGRVNVFDEPEAGIDLWSFSSLVDIFKNSVDEGRLNIIISHQERLFNIADEIILIENGQIAVSGATAEILPRLDSIKSCKKLEGV